MTRFIVVLVALASLLTTDAQQMVRRAQTVQELELFVQHGCTSYLGSRADKRFPDVRYNPDLEFSDFDPKECSDHCKAKRFKYFGFECPMYNRVHCQCYHTDKVEIKFDNTEPKEEDCKALVGSGGDKHCTGPASIKGMSLGGADIGSIYMVADWVPPPPVEEWPKAEYEQHGCTTYYGDRADRRTADVRFNLDVEGSDFNPKQCSDACSKMGHKYFGFECPMYNRVHCQCYGAFKVEKTLGNAEPKKEDCKALVGEDGDKHCTGPTMINGMSLGGADIGSIYKVGDWVPFEEWPEPEFEQHGCTTYYGHRADRRTANVKFNLEIEGGSDFNPKQCSDACLTMGFKYFGFECPMYNRVHCQCYGAFKVEKTFGNAEPKKEDCKALVGEDGDKHCKGPTNIGGMSLGGADIGSVYKVDGWIPFEEWPKSEYVQYGCTTYYGHRSDRRKSDVTYNLAVEGTFDPKQCSDACSTSGFKYFGFECPRHNRVHCQCYSAFRVEKTFGTVEPKAEDCKALVGKDGDKHCTGPTNIDGMSLGGADIGSVFLVGDWVPPPPVEEWPKAEYEQYGCTSYYGSRFNSRATDVVYEMDGTNFNPKQCSDACKKRNFPYFGFECPMNNRVHCQCYSADRVEKTFGNMKPKVEDCKALVGKDGDKHCKGPQMINGMSLGGADIGSIYKVKDIEEPELAMFALVEVEKEINWSEAEYEQLGCTSYYGSRFDIRRANVGYQPDSGDGFDPGQCNDACLEKGFKGFGFECPMNNKVHCQCYSANRIDGLSPERANCKAKVGSDGDKHCTGPAVIDGISTGGADIGSIYKVKGYGPDVPGFQSRLGQCRGAVCSLWGDPHIRTCDGLWYDCQANGIVTLMKNELFNIQGNFVHPPGRKHVTITNDVAIQHLPSGKTLQFSFVPDLDTFDGSGDFYEFGPECPLLFYADGKLQDVNQNLEDSDGYLYGDASSDHSARFVGHHEIRVIHKEKSGGVSEAHLRVSGEGRSCHWNFYVCVPSQQHKLAENTVGLLGTPDGNSQNDWMDVLGNSVAIPDAESKRDLNKAAFEYCHDWCVSEDDSIMEYPEGTSYEDRKCVEDEPYEFVLDDEHCEMTLKEIHGRCKDKPNAMLQSCYIECCNGLCDTIDEVVEEIIEIVKLNEEDDEIIYEIKDPEEEIVPIVVLETDDFPSDDEDLPSDDEDFPSDDEECSEYGEAILMETIGNKGEIKFDSSAITIKYGTINEVTFVVEQLMSKNGIPTVSFSYRPVGEEMTCDMKTMDDGSLIPYGTKGEFTAQCLNGYAEFNIFTYVGKDFNIDECESCSVADENYVGFYFSIPCTPLCEQEICPEYYEPCVCGGKEYSNECKASLSCSDECIPVQEEYVVEEPEEKDCNGNFIPGTRTKLDFFQSEVTQNDLTEKGGEIRYTNIGTYQSRELDLVVTMHPGSNYVNKAKGDNKNGKGDTELFGNINLQTKKHKPHSGEGNFTFCFQDKETLEPVTVDYFYWTVYDLDERGSDRKKGGVGIKEKLIMDVSQASTYQLVKDTEVKLSCEDGSDIPCKAGVRTIFHSSTDGVESDNPKHPDKLTQQQKARSVSFEFRDISCWHFTYDHYCPVDKPDYDGRYGSAEKCRWYGGGNFLYAGESPEMIGEGECLTTSPTTTPIEEGVTEPPVTTAPPEPEEPEVICPEDILVMKTIGVTDYPTNEAVKIVSQDKSTVTVELNQAWVENGSVDSIFTYYRETIFDKRCYESEDVDPGFVKTIEIYCNVFSPKAQLEICVADSLSKEVLVIEDNAEIPPCCYPDLPENTPVVCYSLEINCVTECIDESQQRRLRGGTE